MSRKYLFKNISDRRSSGKKAELVFQSNYSEKKQIAFINLFLMNERFQKVEMKIILVLFHLLIELDITSIGNSKSLRKDLNILRPLNAKADPEPFVFNITK